MLFPALPTLQETLGPSWRMEIHGNGDVSSLVSFRITDAFSSPDAYRLCITSDGVRAEASGRSGLFYAAQAFRQLYEAKGSDASLPCLIVEDAPDFPVRGVMLDISRDKVPTLKTLFELVDLFSRLRFNQLQLYTEHVFAYPGHETAWQNASPLTPDEIRALDAYCRVRCIELVPNQNSFGHLERWLALPAYRSLAELPQGGAPLPWGGTRDYPSALCPSDPASLDFLASLYDALLPCFSSRYFNAGCDETFDLCEKGRSFISSPCGGDTGRTYLDFLKKIYALVRTRGRRMMFWGDILLHHPDLVSELPKDMIALEWGYEADHPFATHAAVFENSGIPFYICPGTSSWRSLAGRVSNMKENVRLAASEGRKHGAAGFLLTDWGDEGHAQPLAISFPGFVYGAAVSWCGETNEGMDLARALDAFGASGLGSSLVELGDLYLRCGALRANATELFRLFFLPDGTPWASGITREKLDDVSARASAIAGQAATLGEKGNIFAQEVSLAAELVDAACQKAEGRWTPACRENLRARFQTVWLLRNRVGGLSDSLAKLFRTSP